MRGVLAATLCVVALVVSIAEGQSFNRAQTISNIFQIPIQTLTAISNFAQNTRPLGELLQRRRSPQVQQGPPSSPFTSYPQSPPLTSYPRSRAARIAGLYVAADGSGFRI